MVTEIWKTVNGFERYQVSNMGRFRSICRPDSPKILKVQISSVGYCMAYMNGFCKPKNALLHRLVSHAFIPNPLQLPEVNHINGIKTDNRVSNLEWCTKSQNMSHFNKMRHKRREKVPGEYEIEKHLKSL